MKSGHFELMNQEARALGITAIVVFTILLIAFYKSSPLIILKMAAALLWLFAIPGMLLLLCLREKLDRMERMVMGALLSAAILGISSYYVGLLGLNLKYHYVVLPIVLDAVGIFLFMRHEKAVETQTGKGKEE